MRPSIGGCTAGTLHAELLHGAARDAPCFYNLSMGEV